MDESQDDEEGVAWLLVSHDRPELPFQNKHFLRHVDIYLSCITTHKINDVLEYL